MFPLLHQLPIEAVATAVVCRCCLLEQPRLCHSFRDNQALSQQLLILAPSLRIVPSDMICDPCLQSLHDALEFRQRCENSERILRARLEQELDDALECLEREVSCLEKQKANSAQASAEGALVDLVDFGSLDLSDTFEEFSDTQLLECSSSWNMSILNTPEHRMDTQEPSLDDYRREQAAVDKPKPKRKRTPRKTPTAAKARSRTPKSLRPCTECEKKFTRNFQLKLHMISVHGLGDGMRYRCEVCAKSFASLHSLRYHVTSLHSTERPFVCEICDRRFVLRTQLVSHARMHTGEPKPRIFPCPECSKTWPTKSDLRTHMRSHDPDMSKRPYKCDRCEKAFFTRGHLNSHHLVHTGEKPYACRYCDKSYQSVGNLNNHMTRLHANKMESELESKYTYPLDIES